MAADYRQRLLDRMDDLLSEDIKLQERWDSSDLHAIAATTVVLTHAVQAVAIGLRVLIEDLSAPRGKFAVVDREDEK